ncbi:MAG: hypothetical protein AAFX04_14380 [Pseudomonadota bacterium]
MIERSISGNGELLIGENSLPVDYHINVFFDGAMRSARGTITGDPGTLLAAMMQRENLDMHLEGGGKVNLILTRSSSSGTFQITISGPVP